MINRFISWLYTRRLWGARCLDYEPGCGCCEAWATHDWLFNGKAHPEDRKEAIWAGQSRPMTGFFVTLTDEQKEKVFSYGRDIRVFESEGSGCGADQGSARKNQ